jgi:hypothetical protein
MLQSCKLLAATAAAECTALSYPSLTHRTCITAAPCVLTTSGFYEHVRDDTIFLTLHDAVVYARTRSVSPRISLTSASDDSALAAAAAKASIVTEEGIGGCQHTWKIGK